MIQLQILTGRRAGAVFDSSTLPLTIGRSPQADLILEEPGVWPVHCRLYADAEGMAFRTEGEALAAINGEPATEKSLRNGDVMTLGGVSVRFGFSPVRRASTALREWLTWLGLAILCLVQIEIIYLLLR